MGDAACPMISSRHRGGLSRSGPGVTRWTAFAFRRHARNTLAKRLRTAGRPGRHGAGRGRRPRPAPRLGVRGRPHAARRARRRSPRDRRAWGGGTPTSEACQASGLGLRASGLGTPAPLLPSSPSSLLPSSPPVFCVLCSVFCVLCPVSSVLCPLSSVWYRHCPPFPSRGSGARGLQGNRVCEPDGWLKLR